MLRQLRIKNFALIDVLVFEPAEALNIITGETGAGKSIILDALGLALGERAENVRGINTEEKSVVEAHFDIRKSGLKHFFENQELDYYDTALLRREISPDGRSRAFINDTPVNLTALRQLAYHLINIHSQHENLALNHPAFQLEVVDTLAGTAGIAQKVKALFAEYKQCEQQLKMLEEEQHRALAETEFKNFQLTELQDLALQPNEHIQLEQEQQNLQHAEGLKQVTSDASIIIGEGEQNITDVLIELKKNVSAYLKISPAVAELHARINSVMEELKDIGTEFGKLSATFLDDPARLSEVNERLDAIYHMVRKHRVANAEGLQQVAEELQQFLSHGVSLEAEIIKAGQRKEALSKSLLQEARVLSEKRMAVLAPAEQHATQLLQQLGMPSARLQLEHRLLQEEEITESGLDQVRILFSANKGSAPELLSRVASGGELSRVMLAIKSLIAGKSGVPVLIFDEIDTGVSGETAIKIAALLAQLGAAHQVIAVTHLPQVAAKGKYHYKVYKEERETHTYSKLKLLDEKERVDEIAKMLQGDKPGTAAYESAREMLS